MFKKRYCLKTLLLMVIVSVVTMVLIITFLIITLYVTKQMTAYIEMNSDANIEKAEIEFSNIKQTSEILINSLHSNLEFRTYFNSGNATYKKKAKLDISFQKLLSNFENFSFICIVTQDELIFSSMSSFKIFNKHPLQQNEGIKNLDIYQPLYYMVQEKEFSLRDKNDNHFFCYMEKIPINDTFVTIITGIDESRFKNIYRGLQQEGSTIYLVNEQNMIDSCSVSNMIGQPVPFSNELSIQDSTFQVELDGHEYNIIHQPFADTDWRIVNQYSTSLYKENIVDILIVILVISIISLVSIIVICTLCIHKMLQPLASLSKAMSGFQINNQQIAIPQNSIKEYHVLYKSFYQMSTNIKELVLANKEEEKLKNGFKLQNLVTQINPHFIHNTLNIVKVMAEIENSDNIVRMLESLLNYIKPSFQSSKSRWTLQQEYHFLDNYIYILNIRFAMDINITLSFDETVYPCSIPKFIIQPLIENCVTHAYMPNKELEIVVQVVTQGDFIKIEVFDNGNGIEASIIKNLLQNETIQTDSDKSTQRTSIGLSNIKHRLELYYPQNHKFSIDSVPNEYTKITLQIPKND